jgi:hypothetical protein
MVLACELDAHTGYPSRPVAVGTFLGVDGPDTVPSRGLVGCRESRVEGKLGSVVVAERLMDL